MLREKENLSSTLWMCASKKKSLSFPKVSVCEWEGANKKTINSTHRHYTWWIHCWCAFVGCECDKGGAEVKQNRKHCAVQDIMK